MEQTDPRIAKQLIDLAVMVVEEEEGNYGPPSRPQESPAQSTRRIVETAVMHLIEQGLLVVPEDIEQRFDGSVRISREGSPVD